MKKYLSIILSIFAVCGMSFSQSLGEIASLKSVSPESKKNVAADDKKAKLETVESIMEKANSGNAAAQLAIGSYYARGERGFAKDGAKAVEWLEKSARQNEKAAMVYLGYVYGEGKLVKRDMKKAVEWREAAAKIGDANDKWSLGNAYLYGFFLPKDQLKALYWITLSAEEGNAEAVVKLIEIYTNLKKEEELAKWNGKFSKMQLEAAEKGNDIAMLAVAEKFMKGGKGLPRNRVQAIFWYKKAAEAGNLEAMDKVAKMYAKGRFLPKNPEKAQAYFEKLANKDSSYCFKISEFYGDGKDGFPRDDIKAAEWYARGAQNGDVSTHIFAVFKYWKIRDIPNAVKWCNKIISDSQKNLAAIGSQASDAKNVQADMIRQTLKIAKTMLSDISSGSPAPADINAYYNSILSQK